LLAKSRSKQYYKSAVVIARSLALRARTVGSVRESVRNADSVVASVKKASFLSDPGAPRFYRNIGLALIASAPIPIVSEVAGSFLIALAIAREYRCRRNVNNLLSDRIGDLIRECLSISF